MSEVTRILQSIGNGDAKAADDLLPLVYDELRRIAAHKMAHEVPGQTLQPTALVHEVWLRLGGDTPPNWQNRAHFFAAAAEAMRRILIDRARSKGRLRRGGEWQGGLGGLATTPEAASTQWFSRATASLSLADPSPLSAASQMVD